MRGFGTETHYARTKDGYHIHLVRVINPKIDEHDLKRPVVFNHGLLESSTIWLINSRGIEPYNGIHQCGMIPIETLSGNATYFLNGPMMLANHGYDVWLMSMRGTDWSLKHDTLKPEDSRFWNYCLDDFALTDVPTVINYVKMRSKFPKVGYIGHSQATFSIFGLLARKPDYADIIEPVIAVAPVAYFDHITSLGKALFLGTLTATSKDLHGPFPPNARKMRKIFDTICAKSLSMNKLACDVVATLVSGNGRAFPKGFFSHLPYYTSLKVLRHFGQLVKHKRFMMYDHGKIDNLRIYGSEESPSYEIKNIRSESISLISTKVDALSPPADVEHFKKELKVPLYRDILIEGDFNHFDLITDSDAKRLVFPHVLEIFESVEMHSGVCSHNVHPEDSEGDQNELLHNGIHSFDHQHVQEPISEPIHGQISEPIDEPNHGHIDDVLNIEEGA